MCFNLDDYFRTTFKDELEMPENEYDHLTAATSLLEKRREMIEVDQALQAQKEEFQMKRESLQQRKEELQRKEAEISNFLSGFEYFLKENDAKCSRAIKKADEEREMKKCKAKEIEKLKRNIHYLLEKRDRNRKKLDNNKNFQNFLDKTLEVAEEFHEISEIISRFHTLTNTHEELMKREYGNQNKVEALKQTLIKYTEEKNNDILGYNNQLATLQTTLDRSQSRAVKWESQWNHIQNTAAKKTLLLGKVKLATCNLYQMVQRYQRARNDEEELFDSNDQLDYIREFIDGFTHIIAEVRNHQATSTSHVSSN